MAQTTQKKRSLAIRVDDEFYRDLHDRLDETGMSLQTYLTRLIRRDIDASAQARQTTKEEA